MCLSSEVITDLVLHSIFTVLVRIIYIYIYIYIYIHTHTHTQAMKNKLSNFSDSSYKLNAFMFTFETDI